MQHLVCLGPFHPQTKRKFQRSFRRVLSITTQGGPAEAASLPEVAKSGNSNNSNAKRVMGTILFGVMAITTAGLGVWQSDRYQWKVQLIEDTKRKMAEKAVDWRNVMIGDKEILHGHKILVRGSFEHSKEILLGPRPPPVGVFGPAAQGLATNPLGFYVITPFRAEDGRLILVNRGWVGRTATTWSHPAGSTTTPTELLVIMSDMEKEGTFSPVNDTVSKKLIWLEEAAVMKAMGYDNVNEDERPSMVVEAIVDDVTNENAMQSLTFPVPKALSKAHEQYVAPPTHLAYAATWFSLSVAAVLIAMRLNRKPRVPVNRNKPAI